MKKLTAFAILAALSISLVSVHAQDGGRRSRRGHFRGPQQTQQTSAETLEQWAAVQAQLKKEFPKQYAEIETLQKTNIFAALEKLRALAKTADIQTPSPFSGRGPESGWRGGRERGGRDGFGGGRDLRGGNRGNSRNAVEAKLKTDFASEYAEITKLRIEAQNKLEALARKAKVTLPEDWNSYQLKLEALRLSGKYKAEFEKIDALMKKGEIRAALSETSQIAKKEGIEPPAFGPRAGWDGRGAPGGEMPGEPARGGRDNPLQKLREVRRKYPEEVKKLEAIRRDDPRAYRDGIRKLIEKYDAEQKKP